MKFLSALLSPFDFIGIQLSKVYKMIFLNNTLLAYSVSMIGFILSYASLAMSDYVKTGIVSFIDILFIMFFILAYYMSMKPYKMARKIHDMIPEEHKKEINLDIMYPHYKKWLRLPAYVFSRLVGLIVTALCIILIFYKDNTTIDAIAYGGMAFFMFISSYVFYLFSDVKE